MLELVFVVSKPNDLEKNIKYKSIFIIYLYLCLPSTETSWCTDSTRRTGGAGGASLVHSPAYEVASWTIVADIVLSVSVGNLLIAVDNVSTTNVLSQ